MSSFRIFPLKITASECSSIEVEVIILYTYTYQREARSKKPLQQTGTDHMKHREKSRLLAGSCLAPASWQFREVEKP